MPVFQHMQKAAFLILRLMCYEFLKIILLSDFSKNVFLYCSEVTEVLIKASKKYRHLLPYIVSFMPSLYQLKSNKKVVYHCVTLEQCVVII